MKLMSNAYRPSFTHLDLEDGDYVDVCDDCGAYTLNADPSQVKHHASCRPVDPSWFNADEAFA